MSTLRIAIITASTRPGRVGPAVTDWVFEVIGNRDDAEFIRVDLAKIDLPFLDEPEPASSGSYTHEHTRSWAQLVGGFDGFIVVTPEYNRGLPAPLKNALDFLYAEWNDKAAGLVVYGSSGGLRAAEQLKSVLGELQIATVRAQVSLSNYDDMKDFKELTPRDYQAGNVTTMVGQLVRWSSALRELRSAPSAG